MRACVRVCVHACACVRVCVCVWGGGGGRARANACVSVCVCGPAQRQTTMGKDQMVRGNFVKFNGGRSTFTREELRPRARAHTNTHMHTLARTYAHTHTHTHSCQFIWKSGHLAITPLEYKWTVIVDWHVHLCLTKIIEVWCQRRPKTWLPDTSVLS